LQEIKEDEIYVIGGLVDKYNSLEIILGLLQKTHLYIVQKP
jgi:hypothetical protein